MPVLKPEEEALFSKRRDLFQKHEVVATIVLATFLQFTAIAELVPKSVAQDGYIRNIGVVSAISLLLIAMIWVMRRIGIWVIHPKREVGQLWISVRIYSILWAAFLFIDICTFKYMGIASMPFFIIFLIWAFVYLLSAFHCRNVV